MEPRTLELMGGPHDGLVISAPDREFTCIALERLEDDTTKRRDMQLASMGVVSPRHRHAYVWPADGVPTDSLVYDGVMAQE